MKTPMSHTGAMQQQYWQAFRKYLTDNGNDMDPKGNPLPLSWHAFGLGKGNERLEAVITSRGEMRVELYLTGDDARRKYGLLKEQCEQEAGKVLGKLEWPKDDCKRQKVFVKNEASLSDTTQWPKHFEWMRRNMEAMHGYFARKLESLI
jgi:hypothetical protein